MSYAYNSANELTSMTDGNGTTAFTYDDWGRMTGKSRGSHSATYGYDYGGKLVSVHSDFPDEGSVAYDYGGDGKRRLRTAGTAETWYNWAGWHVINEEDEADGDGDLARTYVGRALAQIEGTDPATGTARYFLHDHLGSTREIRTAGKALDGQFDYTPYGTAFNASHTDATTRRFTGHDYDPETGLYFAPFRHYAPGLARWTTRDPLGMVDGPNVYAYVGGNPMLHYDLNGDLAFLAPLIPIGIAGAISALGGAVAGGLGAYARGCDIWSGAFEGAVRGGAIGVGAAVGVALDPFAIPAAGVGTLAGAAAIGGGLAGGLIALPFDGLEGFLPSAGSGAIGSAVGGVGLPVRGTESLSGLHRLAIHGMGAFDVGLVGETSRAYFEEFAGGSDCD